MGAGQTLVGDLQPRRSGLCRPAFEPREAAGEAKAEAAQEAAAAHKLQAALSLCGLQRRGLERVDRGAAGLPCFLLPRRVSLSTVGPPELHQSRHRPDAGQLGQFQYSQSLLRPDGTQSHIAAVPGRVRESNS